jgi:RNA polymerase sigma-70 factor (ECF subfamily)
MQFFEKSIGKDELTEYHLEAAIVAEHSMSPDFAATDWNRILSLYDLLTRLNPSPVVLLSRAIVIGKIDGPQKAVDEIHAIPEVEKLIHTHYLFPATLGELYLQLGKTNEAGKSLQVAISLTHSPSEKALLKRKLAGIGR